LGSIDDNAVFDQGGGAVMIKRGKSKNAQKVIFQIRK
jgi:hypothetical protein